MNDFFTSPNNDKDYDLSEILSFLWKKKLLILSITFAFSAASYFYAISIADTYSSKTILAPINQDESLSSKLGSLSPLASLSGVNLPGDTSPKTLEAIERMKSFDFFSTYFLPNIKLENLFAIKKWDINNNIIIYEDSIYNKEKDSWVRDVSHPFQKIPSDQEAYIVYKNIFNITQDQDTQFLTLTIESKSPYLAKEWLNIIVFNINESMKENDRKDAQNSISFLNNSVKLTNLQSLQLATTNLLEQQMQILMMTASSGDYVLRTIDSPVAPEKKSGPNRMIIIFGFSLIGFIFSILILLAMPYQKQE
jgi:capsular polysaccharide biosynthesis protein